MPRPTRRLRPLFALVLVASCSGGGEGTGPARPTNEVSTAGGSVVAENGAVKLTFPAGAVAAPTVISVSPKPLPADQPRMVPGTYYEFGPDGSQFAQPVKLQLKFDKSKVPAGVPLTALRVAKWMDGDWKILDEGAVVDTVAGTVSAAIHSFSSYGIAACAPSVVPPGESKGFLYQFGCQNMQGQYTRYYNVYAAQGRLITLQAKATFAGTVTIQDYSDTPTDSWTWVSSTINGAPMRLIAGPQKLQFSVSAADNANLGEYTITSSLTTPAHACGEITWVMPLTKHYQLLDATNSCRQTIKYSPNPGAIGQPILTHDYLIRLPAGRVTRVQIAGLNSAFSPSLTIFHNGVPVAQSTEVGTGMQDIYFTAPATGIYDIEIASGGFVSSTRWDTPAGFYTLYVL